MIRVRDEGEKDTDKDTGAETGTGEVTAEQAMLQSLDNLTQSGFDEVPDLGNPDGMTDQPLPSLYRHPLFPLLSSRTFSNLSPPTPSFTTPLFPLPRSPRGGLGHGVKEHRLDPSSHSSP
jgi:hypothetical protein